MVYGETVQNKQSEGIVETVQNKQSEGIVANRLPSYQWLAEIKTAETWNILPAFYPSIYMYQEFSQIKTIESNIT